MRSAPTFIRLGLSGTVAFRTEAYRGIEHIVFPVVAMVGGSVVKGLNSEAPEFVPGHVLAQAPGGWNGRPIIAYHPPVGTDTANTPDTWERAIYGQVFNAEFRDNRLCMEAWLNPAQAAIAGDDALEVIARVQAGEMVEVSLGAWVWLEDVSGTSPDGYAYAQRWVATVPDHLAVGLQAHGGKGACSVAMGCGGPRLLARHSGPHVYTATEATMALAALDTPDTPAQAAAEEAAELIGYRTISTLVDQLATSLDLIKSTVGALISDETESPTETADAEEAEEEIEDARLESIQALCMSMHSLLYGIGDIAWQMNLPDPVDISVLIAPYAARVTEATAKALAGARHAALAGARHSAKDAKLLQGVHDQSVALGATCASPAMPYSVNTSIASHATTPPSAPCQCGTHAQKGGGVPMDKIKELAGQLIALAAEFTEADRATLEALKEEQLQRLVAGVTPAPVADPDVAQITKAELASFQRLAAQHAARERAQKDELISALTASGQKAFTAQQLAAKSVDELEALCNLAQVETPDYGARGFAISRLSDAAAPSIESFIPPNPWDVAPTSAKA